MQTECHHAVFLEDFTIHNMPHNSATTCYCHFISTIFLLWSFFVRLHHSYLVVSLPTHPQPLPDQRTLLYNQMTLRSLPEPERTGHSHSFKICKTFQVRSAHRVELCM